MASSKDNSTGDENKVEGEKKIEDQTDNKNSVEDEEEDSNERGKKVPPKKRGAKTREVKKEVKAKPEKDGDDGDDEEDDENTENEDDAQGDKVPLLDQPLEISGTRERKKVQRFTEEFKTEPASVVPIEIPDGHGEKLGNIPRINATIQKYKTDHLKPLHKVLFSRLGNKTLIKRNIKQFHGFDFDKNSDQFEKKKHSLAKLESRVLKTMCIILDLERKGNREDIAQRITEFLIMPKDSGKPVPAARPKRSSAVKANKKGYSESEDEDTHSKPRRARTKKINMKDESFSESDKEKSVKPEKKESEKKELEKKESEKKELKKKESKKKESENEKEKSENEVDEAEEVASEDEKEESSNETSKKKGRVSVNSKKVPKKAVAVNKRGTGNKKSEKKSPRKRKNEGNKNEENAEEDDKGSSSEDEPLAKKTKNPPTDDELKSYVKEILEGANLEEITMKTVCKQVYAHYPEFDLAHKKDFIKQTVKSLPSSPVNQ